MLETRKTEPHFYLVYIFSLHWDMPLIHRSTKNWCEHWSNWLLMSKAIISVKVITSKCVHRLWEADIGTVEYSIATTFRSTGIDTIYCTENTVMYRAIFLFTLIHMFQRIMGIEWIMISLWVMTIRPCTAFVRNCTTVQYVTLRYRDINSQQYFCEFAMRPLCLYILFEVTSTWYWCALCYWKTRNIVCVT